MRICRTSWSICTIALFALRLPADFSEHPVASSASEDPRFGRDDVNAALVFSKWIFCRLFVGLLMSCSAMLRLRLLMISYPLFCASLTVDRGANFAPSSTRFGSVQLLGSSFIDAYL